MIIILYNPPMHHKLLKAKYFSHSISYIVQKKSDYFFSNFHSELPIFETHKYAEENKPQATHSLNKSIMVKILAVFFVFFAF